jgi:small subunit ribosomal protein S16
MLAIRMQRIGRKGHAQYRVIVQDSRFSPSSGRVVEYLGSYNPHTRAALLNKEKAGAYLSNGAQPSERVVKLFSAEGVKLPKWVEKPIPQKGDIRNPDKLRRNRPAEPVAKETPADNVPTAEPVEEAEASKEADDQAAPAENETPAEKPGEAPAEDTPAEPAAEEPATEEPAPAK